MGKHALADEYRSERTELLALGRSLSDEQAAQMTTACPAWSIKDIFAHLAGIGSDILAGNTEGAATEAWANGHVADRSDRSFAATLDEWQTAGDGVSEIMDSAGELFPFQLFVDQWTHGWDIRAALGGRAAARPDMSVYRHFLEEFVEDMHGRITDDVPALTLLVADQRVTLGAGAPIGELELDLFEYARISMGRRSIDQLSALPWPEVASDRSLYRRARGLVGE